MIVLDNRMRLEFKLRDRFHLNQKQNLRIDFNRRKIKFKFKLHNRVIHRDKKQINGEVNVFNQRDN